MIGFYSTYPQWQNGKKMIWHLTFYDNLTSCIMDVTRLMTHGTKTIIWHAPDENNFWINEINLLKIARLKKAIKPTRVTLQASLLLRWLCHLRLITIITIQGDLCVLSHEAPIDSRESILMDHVINFAWHFHKCHLGELRLSLKWFTSHLNFDYRRFLRGLTWCHLNQPNSRIAAANYSMLLKLIFKIQSKMSQTIELKLA